MVAELGWWIQLWWWTAEFQYASIHLHKVSHYSLCHWLTGSLAGHTAGCHTNKDLPPFRTHRKKRATQQAVECWRDSRYILSVLIATGRAPTHRPAAVQIHARRPASAATATSTLSCLSSLLRASIRLCHQHNCILTRNLVSPFAIIWPAYT